MILDTSAVISLLREEAESARFVPVMSHARETLKMSTASYLEAGIVTDANDDKRLSAKLDAILDYWKVELVPVSAAHARIAREAYRLFGKGHHPAKLNFGDCFSYALSMATGEALLFKGNDFLRTDVLVASNPPSFPDPSPFENQD